MKFLVGPAALLAFVLGLSEHASAADLVGTLTLDANSRISIDASDPLPIPAGSTIRFHFGEPAEDGTVPVSLAPADVQIDPVKLPDGRRMHYTLADAARGTLKRGTGGLTLTLDATVRVGVAGRMGREVRDYPAFFTTESTIAVNDKRTRLQTLRGQKISESARTVTLVAGATNAGDAAISKGEAVSVVLIGTFDRLPSLAP